MNFIDDFKSSFPEDIYVPSLNNRTDYLERVFFGIDAMSNYTVTIGVMVRDIGNIAEYAILRLCRLAQQFKVTSLVFLENDSKDNTRDIIKSKYDSAGQYISGDYVLLGESDDIAKDWKATDNQERIAVLSNLPFQSDKSFARRQRMAYARNILRDNMLEIPADYYIIYDADMLGGFSYEGIAHSFSYIWDVCASNSLIYKEDKKYYYDSWAWRDLDHLDEHTDHDINTREYFRGEYPITVTSAFGGLGIYKNSYFPNKKYRYNDTDCDHPTIHIPMYQDGAKIIMNPSQITLYNKTRYVV